jgi:hypothetical protein
VCSQWLAGWKATNEPRRRLKQVPLDFPEEIGITRIQVLQMAGTPDGRLVVRANSEVHILDSSMRVLRTVPGENRGFIAARVPGENRGFIAASDDSIFYASDDAVVHRASHHGSVDAEYQLDDCHFYLPVLAPGGLLFCVIHMDDDDPHLDEIIALDAQTLQPRHRFGRGLLSDAEQLVVGGDELYACDNGNDRLQVFSLTGEHRRSITGEWRSPLRLCFAKDRLYLVEDDPEEEYHEGDEDGEPVEPAFPLQGRRILVLSLQGDILQVVTHPTEPTATFQSICCFDHKLLATYRYWTEESARPHKKWRCAVLALQGL